VRRVGTVPVVLAAAGVAAGHPEHASHEPGTPLVPPAVFLAGVLVLGTALLLDYRGQLGRRLADVSVALGALGVLAGIGLLFL